MACACLPARAVILEKERELHEIHDLRVHALESALGEKERELVEERRKLAKLREVRGPACECMCTRLRSMRACDGADGVAAGRSTHRTSRTI